METWRRFYRVLPVLAGVLLPAALPAQIPSIQAVENNYSYIAPGLPNYGIAQGSIFDIFGANLANSPTGLESPPLKTTLNAVSVTVTVNGVSIQAPLYFVTAAQIGAILPSQTPVGTGQITVTNNGATSTPAPITVVASAFGILTLNNGTGPAAAFDAANNYLTATNAVNPGEAVIIWGTGSGPVSDDNQQSAVTTPLEVDIGGIAATILYKGRSPYPGLDQLNVVVPAGVSGCYTSLLVRANNMSSNFSSIPVAASGRTCSDPSSPLGLNPSQLQALAGKTSFSAGYVELLRVYGPGGVLEGVPVPVEKLQNAGAAFGSFTLSKPFDLNTPLNLTASIPSVGSCTAQTTFSTPGAAGTAPVPPNPLPVASESLLYPGAGMNITGPDGTKSIICGLGGCAGDLGSGVGAAAPADFVPTAGGAFTFDNGAGGAGVSAFNVKVAVNAAVWSNMQNFSTISRSQNALITWSGGDANTYVEILGQSVSGIGSNQIVSGSFTCVAPSSAHQFTVPSAILSFLPATPPAPYGVSTLTFLMFISYTAPMTIDIPGLDLAFYSGSIATFVPAFWQ